MTKQLDPSRPYVIGRTPDRIGHRLWQGRVLEVRGDEVVAQIFGYGSGRPIRRVTLTVTELIDQCEVFETRDAFIRRCDELIATALAHTELANGATVN